MNNRSLAAVLKARAATVCPGYVGEAIDVPTKPNGRVVPYWVLHPGVSGPSIELDLGDTARGGAWSFQVTCAAGSVSELLDLVDEIEDAFYRWVPEVEGLAFGPCIPPPGFTALTLTDRDITPHRYFVPLQFTVSADAVADSSGEGFHLTPDPDHPGYYLTVGLTPDPDHSGYYLTTGLTPDDGHPGYYLIGA